MKYITLSTKQEKVDSVVADLKSKKISSHQLYQINLSRTEKKAKLASKNYVKTKKRKFRYQKPPCVQKIWEKLHKLRKSCNH